MLSFFYNVAQRLVEFFKKYGVVAQFGRAPAWHAGGQGFDPPQLHLIFAKVAELVYALVSKTSGLTAVRVRFPPLAFIVNLNHYRS